MNLDVCRTKRLLDGNILAAAILLCVVSLHIHKSFAENIDTSAHHQHHDEIASEPEDQFVFHYSLVMSAEDALCKPLNILYNQLLDEQEKRYKNSPKIEGINTAFENTQTKAFENVGLEAAQFTKRDELENTQFYTYDFYGNGHHETIALQDQYRGDSLDTEIKILKNDADFRVVLKPARTDIPAANTSPEYEIDPQIVDTIFDYRSDYILRKWPHFEHIKAFYDAHKASSYLPAIGGGSVRIFMHNGSRPYFIQNEFVLFPLHYVRPNYGESKSVVSVFKLTEAGRQDVCYLDMIPSQFSDKMKEESHD